MKPIFRSASIRSVTLAVALIIAIGSLSACSDDKSEAASSAGSKPCSLFSENAAQAILNQQVHRETSVDATTCEYVGSVGDSPARVNLTLIPCEPQLPTGTPVTGIGDKAVFASTDVFGSEKMFTLSVQQGRKALQVTLSDPKIQDPAQAQSKLESIAKPALAQWTLPAHGCAK